MRRLTHEFVAAQFAAQGYLLKSNYVNASLSLDTVCPNGHDYSTRYGNFSSGKRCAKCAGQVITHTEVEHLFATNGYQLLSQYVNAKAPLNFICPNGHNHSIPYGHFKNGNRCARCAGRVSVENVKEAFAKAGYTVLGDYKPGEKIHFICGKNHEHSISWSAFNRGARCAHCAGQVRRHSEVESYFNEHGYKLLSQYKKAHGKLEFQCPLGHRHSISWTKFQSGDRCAYCAGQVVTHEEVKKKFEADGYTLLSEYKNSKTKMDFICPQGHKNKISLNVWGQGSRCRDCATNGYRGSLPGRLYYLKFEYKGKIYYKLGVTNRTVKERYREEKIPYIILMDLYYEDGSIPFSKETIILRKNKKWKYKGFPFLRTGNSELFTKDVLGLDSSQMSLYEVLV